MIDYNKYELMKQCLRETFEVYKETLDVSDYVPKEHLYKTHDWIFKNMKKKQRKIEKEDRKYQRRLKKLVVGGVVMDTTSEEHVLLNTNPMLICEPYRSMLKKLQNETENSAQGISADKPTGQEATENNVVEAPADKPTGQEATENNVVEAPVDKPTEQEAAENSVVEAPTDKPTGQKVYRKRRRRQGK